MDKDSKINNKNNFKPLNLNKKFLSNTSKPGNDAAPTPPKLLTGKVSQQSTWKQLNQLKHWDEIDEEDDLVLVDQPDQTDEMHLAAIRAKERREQEENERLEAQHRAQKKASELADRLAREQHITHQQTALARQQQLERERQREQALRSSPPQPPQKSILTRNPNIPAYNPWTARIEARQLLQTHQPSSPPPWRKPKVKVPSTLPSKPQPITTKIPFYPPSSATNYKFDKIRVKVPRSAYTKTIHAGGHYQSAGSHGGGGGGGVNHANQKNQIDALDGLMGKIKAMMTPQQAAPAASAVSAVSAAPSAPPSEPPQPPPSQTSPPPPPQETVESASHKSFNPPSKPRSMYINNNSRRHSHNMNQPLPSQREEFLRASTITLSEPLHKSFSSQ
ncbi:hypothetical protein E3P99_00785 [Wallemia hederae]|uniref:Uncharacterized protein n=1 Tax=Wallemia hederae TaxID=1540922 RepID=A0A4T0FUD8_9BASI|nr:hypothetical protein E3P99_00785 [Wallemia hederae]